MKRVVGIIAGVLVVLVGLAVAGFAVYMIIWGSPRVWGWLWFVLIGAVIALAGGALAEGDYKSFCEMVVGAMGPW